MSILNKIKPLSPTISYAEGFVRLDSNSYDFGAIEIQCKSEDLKIATSMDGWLVRNTNSKIILVNLTQKPCDKIVFVYTGRLEIIGCKIAPWTADELISVNIEAPSRDIISFIRSNIDSLDRNINHMTNDTYSGKKTSTPSQNDKLLKDLVLEARLAQQGTTVIKKTPESLEEKFYDEETNYKIQGTSKYKPDEPLPLGGKK